MQPASYGITTRIGGTSETTGVFVKPITFKQLDFAFDATLSLLRKIIPKLFSMKNVLDNGADTSIQWHHVSLSTKGRSQFLEEFV